MTPVGRFHIWSISWCPVSTFGIKLTYWILKIRKQILRLHRLLPIASPLGSGEKRGMGSFEPGSHREPLLGQTDLPSTRAWVQAGKMLSASRLNVFGKPERWKKQLRAADSRECSKNVFCTLGMQSHHPETLNYQLQTKRRDVRVHVSSLDAVNHHQRGSEAAWDQWRKCWVLEADSQGPQSWLHLLPASTSPGSSLYPFPWLSFSEQHLSPPDTVYIDFHLCFLSVSA